jgi:hypothetical protein
MAGFSAVHAEWEKREECLWEFGDGLVGMWRKAQGCGEVEKLRF